jgi:hypothetical protein
LKPLTVVAKDAVLRSGPEKAGPILEEHFDRQVGQTILCPVIAETVLLRADRRSKRQAGEDGGEAQG